jgi:hypothetical protein
LGEFVPQVARAYGMPVPDSLRIEDTPNTSS